MTLLDGSMTLQKAASCVIRFPFFEKGRRNCPSGSHVEMTWQLCAHTAPEHKVCCQQQRMNQGIGNWAMKKTLSPGYRSVQKMMWPWYHSSACCHYVTDYGLSAPSVSTAKKRSQFFWGRASTKNEAPVTCIPRFFHSVTEFYFKHTCLLAIQQHLCYKICVGVPFFVQGLKCHQSE